MTDDLFTWMLAAIAGVLLGLFFFGGLWWTIRKGLTSNYAGLWFSGSMLLRTGVVLAGFYIVSGGHWQRMAACLLGFITARMVVLRLERRASESKIKEP